MKQSRTFLMLLFLLFNIVSCDDFSFDKNVENLEHPNDNSLFSDKEQHTETAATILNRWYMAVHAYNGPGFALQTMADVSTCSWGGSGVYHMSSEPREAWNNNISYGYSNSTSRYFDVLYSLLFDANLIVATVENGTEFNNPDLMKMIGKVGQAFSVGYLSLVFDRVWISDENGLVNEDSFDYKEGMVWALQRLDEAIAIAKAENISVPESWLPGGGGENTIFVAFLNSMGARMLVGNVRNSAQKSDINWDKVLDYTNNGITNDFEIFMDDELWFNMIPNTYLVYPGWGRVDMRIVNLMDPNTPDYWTNEIDKLPESSSADARLLLDYEYLATNNFRPNRGKYHFSSYRYSRLDYYITDWIADVVEFSASENEMYKAEALLRLERVPEAAEVVNAGTRTSRGKLPPVEADATLVYNAIHYERMVEFAYTGMGIGFFEMRKEDLLQKGTLLHFPIPGKALEVIPEEYYTYGGTEGVADEDYSTGGWR